MRIPTTYRPTNPTVGYSANDRVTAQGAQNVWDKDSLDWPVSGDHSVIDYGKVGMRRNGTKKSVWAARNVAAGVN